MVLAAWTAVALCLVVSIGAQVPASSDSPGALAPAAQGATPSLAQGAPAAPETSIAALLESLGIPPGSCEAYEPAQSRLSQCNRVVEWPMVYVLQGLNQTVRRSLDTNVATRPTAATRWIERIRCNKGARVSAAEPGPGGLQRDLPVALQAALGRLQHGSRSPGVRRALPPVHDRDTA